MLTWVLGYLLIGVSIFWLAAAIFGVDYDVPVIWQIVAIVLWPLAFAAATYGTLTRQPIDEAAMEQALHRRESRSKLQRRASARRRGVERSTPRSAHS